MTFRVVHKPSNNHVRCPYRIVEQAAGREIDWVNQYLDYEMLRRLADATLRTYAHELLHFLRWWERVHHTDVLTKDALTQTTLLDYVRFQSGDRVAYGLLEGKQVQRIIIAPGRLVNFLTRG